MWLLDKNVPKQMAAFLKEQGVVAKHASEMGWDALQNGVLTRTAYEAGFEKMTPILGGVISWPICIEQQDSPR